MFLTTIYVFVVYISATETYDYETCLAIVAMCLTGSIRSGR